METAALPGLVLLALRQACPLLLASAGGVLSERSGVINIALEGMMLSGAFVGMWVGQDRGVVAGLVAALVSGLVLALVHLIATQRLKVNQVVSGVALNLLALNATTFLLRRVFNQADPPRAARIAETLPWWPFVLVALLVPVVSHIALYQTSWGLRLRASGESDAGVRAAGVSPGTWRTTGVLASGVLAGAAGAFLSLSLVGRFTDDMVSGRGFIALAAVVCGRWTPLGAALACCAFGFCDAVQLRMQGVVALSPEVLRALPYALTIVAAAAFSSSPPADLGNTVTDD